MKLTIDFETRSAVEIRRTGAWRYAEDPTTEVVCLAVKRDDLAPWIWTPRPFTRIIIEDYEGDFTAPLITDGTVRKLIAKADVIEAHNAEFEVAVWHHIMHKRLGFPDLDVEKVYCTAAQASMHSLPRDLGGAGAAMGLSERKDEAGRKLMLKMCRPRKARKGEDKDALLWHESPEEIIGLIRYCLKDVDSERELSKSLRPLPEKERKIWKLDQRINRRGVRVASSDVSAIIATVQAHEADLLDSMRKTTPFSPKQVAATLGWLDLRGVELPDLTKQTVLEALEQEDLPEDVREVLETRIALSKSSVAKYQSIQKMAGLEDDRMRGLFMYHGASTGRWSGKGFQPQNLPRGSFSDVEEAIKLMYSGDIDMIEMLYGNVLEVASTLIRPMLIPAPGYDFISADYSSIEARGTAWLAEEERVLEIFRGHGMIYEAAAVYAFGGSVEQVTPWERQVGKTIILACGYQGHVGAFQQMAKTVGLQMSDDEAEDIVNEWRNSTPNIVQLWHGLEDAAMKAVKSPERELFEYNNIKFQVRNGFLMMRLPSGRLLHYPSPGTRVKDIPVVRDGKVVDHRSKEVVTYYGVDSTTNRFTKLDTYGGKLTENAVQALCRDILAEAMLRIEKPYEIVMHVHDEILMEVPEGQGSVEEVCEVMVEVPPWAEGLPIAAEGWRGKRYRK